MAKRLVASLNTAAYDELLAVIKEARKEAKVSQETLSYQLGQAESYIRKIESKVRRVDAVELYQIAVALKLDPTELFDRFVKRIH